MVLFPTDKVNDRHKTAIVRIVRIYTFLHRKIKARHQAALFAFCMLKLEFYGTDTDIDTDFSRDAPIV